MNIGLYGGSFNPPHLGHLIVAETLREQFRLDQIWWIPARQPPHKAEATLVSPQHRLAMTRRATHDHPAFAVSDVEVQRAGASYTVDTVRALQTAHPDETFSLLLGSDSLRHFSAWRDPEEIVARVSLIVYPRPGAAEVDVESSLAGRVRFAEAPLLAISGTAIRARLRAGRSIRYLVPEAVRVYIEQHGLYVKRKT